MPLHSDLQANPSVASEHSHLGRCNDGTACGEKNISAFVAVPAERTFGNLEGSRMMNRKSSSAVV